MINVKEAIQQLSEAVYLASGDLVDPQVQVNIEEAISAVMQRWRDPPLSQSDVLEANLWVIHPTMDNDD